MDNFAAAHLPTILSRVPKAMKVMSYQGRRKMRSAGHDEFVPPVMLHNISSNFFKNVLTSLLMASCCAAPARVRPPPQQRLPQVRPRRTTSPNCAHHQLPRRPHPPVQHSSRTDSSDDEQLLSRRPLFFGRCAIVTAPAVQSSP